MATSADKKSDKSTEKTSSSSKTTKKETKSTSKDSTTKSSTTKKPSTTKKTTTAKSTAKTSKTTSKKKQQTNKILKSVAIWIGVFILTLIIVDYAVQYLNHKASAAIVNGERIYQGEFNDRMVETYGTTTISQMIDEVLIYQEAEASEITVSDEEIAAEIATLEENYGGREELESELALRNITMDRLEEQIRTSITVEKILLEDVVITDEEMQEFYEQYKDVLFSEDEDPSFEEAKEQIEDTLMDQKLNEAYQVWMVEIREGANIKDNISDPKEYEFLGITRTFVVDLTDKS